MTVVGEEDDKLLGKYREVGLRSVGIETDVIAFIVWSLGKVAKRRVAHLFATGDGYLYIDHATVALQFGILTRAGRRLLNVDVEVIAQDVMTTGRKRLQRVGCKETQHFGKEWVEGSILLQLV